MSITSPEVLAQLFSLQLDALLRFSQAAAMVQRCENTFRKLVRKYNVPVVRDGRCVWVTVGEVRKLIQRMREEGQM